MDKVQDSCTGPRCSRIARFSGTIRQDHDKVSKNLGILGNLGPVHESWFLGILGLCRFYEGVMWKYVVYSKKMHVPCAFWWWTSEFVQRVFIFWSKFWKWRTGFWFCIIGCFFKTDDCNRNHFTYSVFKKHWYLQWFLHVPHFERWRWRYICDTPPPAGRPWEGGWPYIYICLPLQYLTRSLWHHQAEVFRSMKQDMASEKMPCPTTWRSSYVPKRQQQVFFVFDENTTNRGTEIFATDLFWNSGDDGTGVGRFRDSVPLEKYAIN